jgi:CheY-like chemotaxis protein
MGINPKTMLRVLMVEDSAEDCELICHDLENRGYTLFVERVWCEQALRNALEEVQWDIVLVDYTLPGFCCLAALGLVRAKASWTLVLCMTGNADPNILRRIHAAGAHACLNKNDLSALYAAMEGALKQSSSVV